MSVLHWIDFGEGTTFNDATGPQALVVDGVDVSVTGDELSQDSEMFVRSFPHYVAGGEAFDPTSSVKI